MLTDTRKRPTREYYNLAFESERKVSYPLITMFERDCCHAIDRERLETAARVLACPVKMNPPNWQHGRLIYAVLRQYLQNFKNETVNLIDIGTAKGFSALCMLWAAQDAGVSSNIISCDVIDPDARVSRNTVSECDGLKTLPEILRPWEPLPISFKQLGGTTLLSEFQGRINFCFVDGKHKYEVVRAEAALLRMKQKKGDIVLFDDVHVPGVRAAVDELQGYDKEFVTVNPIRKYCLAARQ